MNNLTSSTDGVDCMMYLRFAITNRDDLTERERGEYCDRDIRMQPASSVDWTAECVPGPSTQVA
jgi:hypothetical protein